MSILQKPKISDVIAELQKLMEEHGDLPVRSSAPGDYYITCDDLDIDISTHHDFIFIDGEH